jgi:hypothetical protein
MWNTRTIGTKDWEVTCDGLVAMTGSSGQLWDDIFLNYLDDTNVAGYLPKFSVRFMTSGGNTTGDKFFYGDAILSSLSIDAPQEQSTTMSVSFVAAGPLYLGTQ